MPLFRKYNIRFFLLLIPAAVLYFSVDLLNVLKRIDGYVDINRGDHDVVFFGDSSVYTVGSCDSGRQGVGDWLADLSGKRVYTVAGPGYTPFMYTSFIHRLSTSRTLPGMVVVPINLRNFSEQWFSDPQAARSVERAAMDLVANPFSADRWPSYLRARFSDEIKIAASEWQDQSVVYGDLVLGVRQDIDNALRTGLGAAKSFECQDAERFPYAQSLTLRYQYHYMNIIESDHQLFGSIAELAGKLKALGIRVVFYLTPINIDAVGHYIGSEAVERVSENVEVIKAWFARKNLPILDLSAFLPDDRFVDKSCACEHYDDTGRKLIAGRLAGTADLRKAHDSKVD